MAAMTFDGFDRITSAGIAETAGAVAQGLFGQRNQNQIDISTLVIIAAVGVFGLIGFVVFLLVIKYIGLWVQAKTSNARVSMTSLIGMGFRQVDPRIIVNAKIMATQAGLDISEPNGVTTARLEAH